MRLVTYKSAYGPRVAVPRDGGYVDLNWADPSLPACMKQLLSLGKTGLERAARAVASAQILPEKNLQLLAPIPRPDKVICIGLNYIDHAKESGQEPPPEPVVFNKFPSSVIAPLDPIVLPKLSQKVDYEAELVVVIGAAGKHIAEADALNYVAGYCCGHDVSARDWQHTKPAGQWLLGKTFDTFAPLGPELVTADEVGDAGKLRVQFRLNGQTLQDGNTDKLIFSVPKLIAYISGVITLAPGDVIYTGTPPGVGAARKPPIFMKPGDVAEVEIEKLGVLKNPVVGEA